MRLMKYPVIMVAVLLLSSLACSLSGGNDPTPTPVFPTSTPLTPTATLAASLTPSPSPTGGAVQPVGTLPATLTNCTPQRSWPQYMVAAGDTLGYIALATNSTVEQLRVANCLANPELIYVGQLLYVPVLPAPPPPITQVQTVVVTVEVSIEPGITNEPGTVEPGITVEPTTED